jgi:L-amino acid N-acyltransferase YncA
MCKAARNISITGLAQDALLRYGPSGCMKKAISSVCRLAYMRQNHFWYKLDLLAKGRPLYGLWRGLRLIRAGEHDVPLLEQLQTVGQHEARNRLHLGADLWIVRKNETPVFSCWTFRNRSPVFAARGGWLELPDGTVCLEDSMTAPVYRGLAVGPAAWSQIGDLLAGEGVGAMITKIDKDNAASRRAVQKIGFKEIASMTHVRIGPWSAVEVDPIGEGGDAMFLVDRLISNKSARACKPRNALH